MRLLYVRSKENGCEKALCNADGNPCDKNCVGHIDSAVAVEISGGFRIGEFCGKGAYADCIFSLNENVKSRHISNFLKEIYYIS